MWDALHFFYVCKEFQEGWVGKPVPASQVEIEGKPAVSVNEAVEFLKANPNYQKEKDYYLVKEEQVWLCIFKRGRGNQEKAHSMMDQYIKAAPTAGEAESASSAAAITNAPAGGRDKSRSRQERSDRSRDRSAAAGEPGSTAAPSRTPPGDGNPFAGSTDSV